MIIFLHGADDYRREEKKRAIVDEFKKRKSGLALASFDFENETEEKFNQFNNFLANQSIFESAKMAVLGGIFEIPPKELQEILKIVEQNKSITVLISEKEKIKKDFSFLLEKPILVQEFDYLSGAAWEKFLKIEMEKRSLKLESDIFKLIADVFVQNTWGLITELDKLALLSGSEKIRKATIGELQLPLDFWSLIMGLKSGSISSRMLALEKVFGKGEPAAKIFNLLAYQFPERKSEMANYDLMVKSGKMEYEEVLVDLAISVT